MRARERDRETIGDNTKSKRGHRGFHCPTVPQQDAPVTSVDLGDEWPAVWDEREDHESGTEYQRRYTSFSSSQSDPLPPVNLELLQSFQVLSMNRARMLAGGTLAVSRRGV